ncbi:MAG: NAD(P)H-dependent oxidoreductase subunit E, partial [Halodesulfurarchaeum sp.]
MSSGSHNAVTGRAEIQGVDLRRVLATLDHDRQSVLPALQEIQGAFGYLPESALEYVADEFETPLATIVGIATFYEQFSLEPQGEHVVRVCTGTACHVNDSADILA